jgi:hypothetical protein
MFSVWRSNVELTIQRLTHYSSATRGSIWPNGLESRGEASASIKCFGASSTYHNVESIGEVGGVGGVDPAMDLGIEVKVGTEDTPFLF